MIIVIVIICGVGFLSALGIFSENADLEPCYPHLPNSECSPSILQSELENRATEVQGLGSWGSHSGHEKF